MIDFVNKKGRFFLLSAILIIAGVVSLAVSGLAAGTDFAGGVSLTVTFDPPVAQGDLRQEMADLGYGEATIQDAGEGAFIIHLGEISSQEASNLAQQLGAELNSQGSVSEYYAVSPAVGAQTARNAGIAVVMAAIAMLFYIVWAFRRMPNPFRWGVCAVVALVHDILIIVGIFSFLGRFAGVQVDAMFITGLLAVVGYSINNTVVIFDRIRENVHKGISKDFAVTVNHSIVETLGRSLNTSLTTLLVVLALFLFGGATIHYFVLVLFLGIIVGTYSSLCISGQFLTAWEKNEWGELFHKLPFTRKAA